MIKLIRNFNNNLGNKINFGIISYGKINKHIYILFYFNTKKWNLKKYQT